MSPTSLVKGELRILTPIGCLGYGFSEQILRDAIDSGIDAIIADCGSTDSGPAKLAMGSTTVTHEAYVKDLEMLLACTQDRRIPILLGSAGGDGANDHVDMFLDIIQKAIQTKGYRPMKVISIMAEIDKTLIRAKHLAGEVKPCSIAVPPLTDSDIDDATRVVAQMGLEPYVKAMEEHPDFDIIVGGRAYDPSPYTAFCVYSGFDNLGIAFHMGKIMECGAMCAIPKSREMLATIRHDSFDVTPLDSKALCTVTSVASHTLYEKSRPDFLLGPGGRLNVTKAIYEALPDHKSVRVSGATFEPIGSGNYTIKLEGARARGYHSAFIGGIRDPFLIAKLDGFIAMVKDHVANMVSYDFDLQIRVYGRDACMGPLEPALSFVPKEVALCGEARATTQEQANYVANLARISIVHGPYKHQLATSGNFAMPFAPYDIPLGPVCEFNIYHLMTISDDQVTSLFPITLHEYRSESHSPALTNGHTISSATTPSSTVGEPKMTTEKAMRLALGRIRADTSSRPTLSPPPPAGCCYLADVASVIRSKNAGPYELTFDIMFNRPAVYKRVKAANVLNSAVVARLYSISEHEDIVACLWWDPAMAFKATIKRPFVSGAFGEADVHGSQQHVPFMYLVLPFLEQDAAAAVVEEEHTEAAVV